MNERSFYQFTIFCAIFFQSTIFYANFLPIHYLSREFPTDSLSFARYFINSLSFMGIFYQFTLLFRESSINIKYSRIYFQFTIFCGYLLSIHFIIAIFYRFAIFYRIFFQSTIVFVNLLSIHSYLFKASLFMHSLKSILILNHQKPSIIISIGFYYI